MGHAILSSEDSVAEFLEKVLIGVSFLSVSVKCNQIKFRKAEEQNSKEVGHLSLKSTNNYI